MMVTQLQDDVRLFNAANLSECPWPNTPEGNYAKAFLTPFILDGVERYIKNIKTEYRVLIVGNHAIPLTINEKEYENSYVCSPYSYYISYARHSLNVIPQKWLAHSLDRVLGHCGQLFKKCHFNRVVVVNNWPFSTTLYPPLDFESIKKMHELLFNEFPHHTILFRSVDPHTNRACFDGLQTLGFKYIATRQIYYLDPNNTTFFESRLFKSDLKLLRNSDYEIIDNSQIQNMDLARLLELYQKVYIEKYSQLNPQFNLDFLELFLDRKLVRFKGLKRNGRIDGIVGYIELNGCMYCPFFGYDTSLEKEIGLYRNLNTLLFLEAQERRLFFHQSSGASAYKKMRKANHCIEYTAIFNQHLPFSRKIPWFLIKQLYNHFGQSYMEKY